MQYRYKGESPLEVAQRFIDSYIEKVPAEKLPPEGAFTYHQGVFLSGVESIYRQNKKEAYDAYIKAYLSIVLEEDKKAKRREGDFWVSLDSLDFRQPGNLLVRLYEESGDGRYLDSIAELCESLLKFPTNAYGGFWHMKSQPNQMWLDSLYMASPLCAKYARLSGKQEFAALAVRQAELMYEHMRDTRNNLLYHGWDDSGAAPWADKETGLSAEKWGRAIGWFVVATVEILEATGMTFDGADRLRDNLAAIFHSLVQYQSESGFWYQVIDKPQAEGNWTETSCTCLIAYAMAKAVRLQIAGREYLAAAKKAYEAVTDSLTEKDGALILDGICIGTCIDEGTYEHYIGRQTVSNDLHGSGAFLLMCGEMNQCEG